MRVRSRTSRCTCVSTLSRYHARAPRPGAPARARRRVAAAAGQRRAEAFVQRRAGKRAALRANSLRKRVSRNTATGTLAEPVQDEAARNAPPVDGLLQRRDQLRRALHLVEDRPFRQSRDEPDGILERGAARRASSSKEK